MEIKQYKDYQIQLRSSSDAGVFQEIIINNCYGIDFKWFDKIKTIIDIGGHIGIFSLFIAPYVDNIYTFEPYWQNYRLLVENVDKNNLLSKIKCYKKAVTHYEGMIDFYESKQTHVRHTIVPPGQLKFCDQGEKIVVPCISLRTIMSTIEHPTLLKIDIEGGEYSLLFNTPEETFKNITRIVMETHHDESSLFNKDDLIKKLKSYGYKVSWKFNWKDPDYKMTTGDLIAIKE